MAFRSILIILFGLTCLEDVFCQDSIPKPAPLPTYPKYPNSVLEIGLGIGPNFGIIGTKMVLGYKGNGLLIGLGFPSGQIAQSFGVQASAEHFFLNFSYGISGRARPAGSTSAEDVSLVHAKMVMAGCKINLNEKKTVGAEFGIGLAIDGYFTTVGGMGMSAPQAFILGGGFVVRIG